MTWDEITNQIQYLPDYLSAHLLLTITALSLAILICIPLGALATRINSIRWPLMTIASIMQTIPGIALLALMVPLLGQIGFLPALIALFIYSLLPILRNTVTGILEVDTSLIEAADGIGLSNWQKLRHIEFPLALPIIIAGIRTSAVWVVGTATLSTPVGAKSLGNYIFSGLQTQNFTAVLVGCISAACLAIIVDQTIRLFESGLKNRRSLIVSILIITVLIVTSLFPAISQSLSSENNKKIIIGAKTFTEQYILSEMIGLYLKDAGYEVEVKSGMGSTILFDALSQNEVDCYIDYSGTIWANAMKQTEIPNRDTVLIKMSKWLYETHRISCLGALGFENAYAIAVLKTTADKFNLSTINDLGSIASRMTMGSDYEFLDRPEWQSLSTNYDLPFKEFRKLDHSLIYSAMETGDIDVMPAYSTDGKIIDFNLTLLSDPKQALPPYDAVLLLSPVASQNDKLKSVLLPLIGAINNELMREGNQRVDSKNITVSETAKWLKEKIE